MPRTELLSIKQVIAELGDVARATFYRWRATGKFPKRVTLNGVTHETVKLPNGQVRMPRPLLEYFLAECVELD